MNLFNYIIKIQIDDLEPKLTKAEMHNPGVNKSNWKLSNSSNAFLCALSIDKEMIDIMAQQSQPNPTETWNEANTYLTSL